MTVAATTGLAIWTRQWPVSMLLGAAVFAASIALFHTYINSRRAVALHHLYQQEIRELWALAPVAVGRPPLAAPGGWALGAAAVNYVTRLLGRRESLSIVECGPGVSSVLLHAALTASNPEICLRFEGLEHDAAFYMRVRELLDAHGVDNYSLHLAELAELSLEGWRGSWYDVDVVSTIASGIDLLIVDGPPATSRDVSSRFPAYPTLRSKLNPGALIVVDDTTRVAERRMVASWTALGGLDEVFRSQEFVALRYSCDG